MARLGWIQAPAPYTVGDANETAQCVAARKVADALGITCWFGGPKINNTDPPASIVQSPGSYSISRYHGWVDILASRNDSIVLQVSAQPSGGAVWRALDLTADWSRVNLLDGYACRPPAGVNNVVWNALWDSQIDSMLEMASYGLATYGVDFKPRMEVHNFNEPRQVALDATLDTTVSGAHAQGALVVNLVNAGALVADGTRYVTIQHGGSGGTWYTYRVISKAANAVTISYSTTATGVGLQAALVGGEVVRTTHYQNGDFQTYKFLDAAELQMLDSFHQRVRSRMPGYWIWGPPMHGAFGHIEEYLDYYESVAGTYSFIHDQDGITLNNYPQAQSDAPFIGFPLQGVGTAKDWVYRGFQNYDHFYAKKEAIAALKGKPVFWKEWDATQLPYFRWGKFPFKSAEYGKAVRTFFTAAKKRPDIHTVMLYGVVNRTPEGGPITLTGNATAAVREMIRGSSIDLGTVVPAGFANAGGAYVVASGEIAVMT